VPADLDPLTSPVPVEVPLDAAPLVRVVAQVRFPLVVAIDQQDFIGPFQEAVRAEYPVLRHERTHGLLVTLDGVPPAKPQTAWRFSDLEGHWRVSLTPEFLALETTAYKSRTDFLERLRTVLLALDKHVDPKLVDRLGVRYVDRVSGSDVGDITKLVREEVRGITGTSVSAHVQHALTETLFAIGDRRVLTRWGRLPPGGTTDPGAIEPIDEPSWILDLDMFSTEAFPFDVERLIREADEFAQRLYALFRWAVTNDFLIRYGGKT
jgi:uncharacterized protein (TIGR04255 family)